MNFKPDKIQTLEQKKITSIETAKGSIYKYLQDGRTQRFKKVEDKEYEPQDVIVFIPDWESLLTVAPKEFLDRFDNNGMEYKQTLLEYAQKKKIYIVDESGKKLSSNNEKELTNKIIAAFCEKGSDKADFTIPVSGNPKEGFYTYDTRKYYDEKNKTWMREQHMGNKVVKINY